MISSPLPAAAAGAAPRLSAQADRLMMLALAASTLIALAIGQQYHGLSLAASIGLPLLALGVAAGWLAPGSTLSRLTLAAALMAMTALHIQLARGTTEYHFGVFVTLALLLA